MKHFLVDIIKFNNRVSKQRLDEKATEPTSTKTVRPTENPNSLFRPTLGLLDGEVLRVYKAMDLAG